MRRTKEEAEQTRRNLLEAALDEFYHRGFSNTSLAGIAAAAGVTRGAVYWHFNDKTDLYLTIYDELTTQYHVRPEDYENKEYESLADFSNHIKYYLNLFATNKTFNRFLQLVYSRTEYIDALQSVRDNEAKKQRASIAAYTSILEKFKDRGLIHEDIHCNRMAKMLYAMIDGIIDSWGIDPQLYVKDISDMVDDWFRMLTPRM